MGILKNFVTSLHQQTKRNYIERMNNEKVKCSKIAKRYEKEYGDGDRKFGYGGYKYIPGRWKDVAQKLIDTYKLKSGSSVLDVGCGKGFLLYEMKLLLPDLKISGFDISKYALADAKAEIKKDQKKTIQIQSEMPGLDENLVVEKPNDKASESKEKEDLEIPSFLRNQSN